MHNLIYLIPLLTVFAGWFIIKIFSFFLFYPEENKKFMGISLQGILPRYKNAIIDSLTHTIVENIRQYNNWKENITGEKNLQAILPVIETQVDDFLRNKLKAKMPVVGMLIGDKTINGLKEIFITELKTIFPSFMENYISKMVHSEELDNFIKNKLTTIWNEGLYKTAKNFIRKKLQVVALFAALIAFFFALLQLLIIWLAI